MVFILPGSIKLFKSSKGTPPLSSLEKDKDIDLDILQDLMEVDIDPLDIDLEKDPLAAKVFKVWNTSGGFGIAPTWNSLVFPQSLIAISVLLV